MREAREKMGLTQADVANATGYKQTAIGQMESGETTAPRRWQELCRFLGIPMEQFRLSMLDDSRDARRIRTSKDLPELQAEKPSARMGSPVSFGPRRIPVYGRAVGGVNGEYIFNGEPIDYVSCPPSLDGVSNAYAVYVDGESMAPRYDPGDEVWVHPSRPARPGNDVIVQIASRDGEAPHGYIKRFVGWTGSRLKLRQYNPDKEITYDRSVVVSIHTIIGVHRG